MMKIISNLVIGFIGTALTASIMWMVTEIASMSDVKIEMRYMNDNIENLNETIKDSSKRLDIFNEHHTQNLSIISKAIAINANEIDHLERRCKSNEEDITKCNEKHMNGHE